MIIARLQPDRSIMIPPELIAALGLQPGDEIAIDVVGDRIVVAAADEWPDAFVNDFSTFTEWSSKADCEAFDKH